MAVEDGNSLLKTTDVLARLGFLSPLVMLFAFQVGGPSGPVTGLFVLEMLGVFAAFVFGLGWICWRFVKAPAGTYPLIERLLNDSAFRIIFTVSVPVGLFLFGELITWLKGHNL